MSTFLKLRHFKIRCLFRRSRAFCPRIIHIKNNNCKLSFALIISSVVISKLSIHLNLFYLFKYFFLWGRKSDCRPVDTINSIWTKSHTKTHKKMCTISEITLLFGKTRRKNPLIAQSQLNDNSYLTRKEAPTIKGALWSFLAESVSEFLTKTYHVHLQGLTTALNAFPSSLNNGKS